MAKSSSKNEVFDNSLCSKDCKKNTKTLNSKITEISDKLADKDLSWTGLPECADDTISDYSRPSPTLESTSGDDQNRNSSAFENGESTDSILSKPAVKFVKAAERSTSNKVEAVKKPFVRYVKLFRKPSKKSTVRGNQRNWNNYKSQQLGVKKGTTRPQNNTHKSMPPRPSIHRPYRPPMRPVRPNMNVARPKRTSFYKPAHSYNKRPFQDTTQELMIILIQRVQRLERKLKARTPIHKVDKGRSKPVMAWVPKKLKKAQEKDKIGSKPDKNRKRGEAGCNAPLRKEDVRTCKAWITECQPTNEDYFHEQNSCFNSNSFGFDHCQPLQYTVDHPIFNAHNDFLKSQNELSITQNTIMEQMTQLTSICELVCQIIQKKQEEKRIEEEQAANARYWKIPSCCDDDDDDDDVDCTIAITPILSTEETDNSLSMGDEHLDAISATESDEVIKSSVEDLVLIPSESEGVPDTMCDVTPLFIKKTLGHNHGVSSKHS
nr:hypothetical protein [Tanacetum cinerariifolium]